MCIINFIRINQSYILFSEDIHVRWPGNHVPEDGTLEGTLGQFYDIHKALPHASIYFSKVPSSLKSGCQGQYVRLLLSIDILRVHLHF